MLNLRPDPCGLRCLVMLCSGEFPGVDGRDTRLAIVRLLFSDLERDEGCLRVGQLVSAD